MSLSNLAPYYLVRTPYSYYFRFQIPQDLRHRFGRHEIKRSLRTGYLGIAKRKSRLLAGRVQELIDSLRAGHMKELSKAQVQDIINRYVREALASSEEYRAIQTKPSTYEDIQQEAMAHSFIEADCREDLVCRDYQNVESIVDSVLGAQGITLDKDSDSYRILRRELLKAQIDVLKFEQNRIMGDFSDDETIRRTYGSPEPATRTTPHTETDNRPQITLQELLDRYIGETSNSMEWKKTTVKEYNSLGNLIKVILGNKFLVSGIDHVVMNDFKATLQRIPAGMLRFKKFRGKSVDEILKMEYTDTLSTARINQYLTMLGAIFRYAVKHGYMDENYADGLKLKQKRRANKQQDVFTRDDLRTLFHSDDYTKDLHNQPHKFWSPILGLYTGCRIEELCQLHLDDIQHIDGIWCLNIHEEREDQSIKNAASERVVPLHPFIVEDLNFIAGYVESLRLKGEQRLFPELSNNAGGKYSHQPVKWFGKWRLKAGIKAPPRKKTFHSFRHTLTNHLKQQLVDRIIVDELTGHVVEGESYGRYGKEYPAKILYENAILKLNYAIDLSHLRKSKYVVVAGNGRWKVHRG